jgi:hypothetical protein
VARADFILADISTVYGVAPIEPAFRRLYPEEGSLSSMFAAFHTRLNGLFDYMNDKKNRGGHFNADPSRDLLDLYDEIEDRQRLLKSIGVEFSISDAYSAIIEESKGFLVRSGGSGIPDAFGPIAVERYAPVFELSDEVMPSRDESKPYQLTLIGEGSYEPLSV